MRRESHDFETYTGLARTGETDVWLAGWMNWDNPHEWGWFNTLDGYINRLNELEPTCITFHNWLKFDCFFLLPRLIQAGWTVRSRTDGHDITSPSGVTHHVIDTVCLMPISVKDMGDTLGDISKGETPLVPFEQRPYIATDTDLDYMKHDLEIPIRYGNIAGYWEKWTNGYHTIPSLAYSQLMYDESKDLLTELVDKRDKPVMTPHSPKLLNRYGISDTFTVNGQQRDLKPRIIKELINQIVKPAYKGGLTIASGEVFKHTSGASYDINSMYPSIYSQPLPRIIETLQTKGLPSISDTPEWSIVQCTINATVKPGKLACIKRRADQGDTVYENILDGVYTLTGVELSYIRECYHVHSYQPRLMITYSEDKELTGKLQYHCDRFIKEKNHARATDNKVQLWWAKLMLNAAYGRFGMMPRMYNSYEWTSNGQVKTDNVVSGNPVCELSTAVFITAYGRIKLARDVNSEGLDRVMYMDTDSIHLLDDSQTGLDTDPYKLGAYKREYTFTGGVWLAPKTYGEWRDDKGWRSVCAGVTGQVPPNKLRPGVVINVKRKVQVNGGVLILDVPHTINCQ